MNSNQKEILFRIFILKANLIRSTKLMSCMNPYVKISTQRESLLSSICKKGDKKPIWNEAIIITLQDKQESIQLQIYDYNSRDEHELIGEITLNPFELVDFNGDKDLLFKGNKVGQIELQLQQYKFPNEYVSNINNRVKQQYSIQEYALEKKEYHYPEQ